MIAFFEIIDAVGRTSSLDDAGKLLGINRNAVANNLKRHNMTAEYIRENKDKLYVEFKLAYIHAIDDINSLIEFQDLSAGEKTALNKIATNIKKRVAECF